MPTEPLIQTTAEKPSGPLTLRVYPATDPAAPCGGEVYTDDGHTFAYRNGAYARIHLSCSRAADGSFSVPVAPQEGSYTPWWTVYRMEIFGWTPKSRSVTISGAASGVTAPVQMQQRAQAWGVDVLAEKAGLTVRLH